MSVATYIVIGIQIVLSVILIVVVLFQSGNQRGLSGSIAGGAETFFGKNKGRTIDAKLKKWTTIVAVLFLVSSIVLSLLIQNDNNNKASENQTNIEQQVEDVQNSAGTEGQVGPESENAESMEENSENSESGAETETSNTEKAENAENNSEAE